MVLLVDRRFYLITLLNFSYHVGGLIRVQTNFGAVLGLDKIIGVIHAEQFPVDGLRLPWESTVLPLVPLLIIIRLKIILLRFSQRIGFHHVPWAG